MMLLKGAQHGKRKERAKEGLPQARIVRWRIRKGAGEVRVQMEGGDRIYR